MHGDGTSAIDKLEMPVTASESSLTDTRSDGLGPGLGLILRVWTLRGPECVKDHSRCWTLYLSSRDRQLHHKGKFSSSKATLANLSGGFALPR